MIELDNKTFDRIKQYSVATVPSIGDSNLAMRYDKFYIEIKSLPNDGESFKRRYELLGYLNTVKIEDEFVVYKILMKILDKRDQERVKEKEDRKNYIKEFLES